MHRFAQFIKSSFVRDRMSVIHAHRTRTSTNSLNLPMARMPEFRGRHILQHHIIAPIELFLGQYMALHIIISVIIRGVIIAIFGVRQYIFLMVDHAQFVHHCLDMLILKIIIGIIRFGHFDFLLQQMAIAIPTGQFGLLRMVNGVRMFGIG